MNKVTNEHIENRIARLSQKPVENARLIKKWKRIQRKNVNG